MTHMIRRHKTTHAPSHCQPQPSSCIIIFTSCIAWRHPSPPAGCRDKLLTSKTKDLLEINFNTTADSSLSAGKTLNVTAFADEHFHFKPNSSLRILLFYSQAGLDVVSSTWIVNLFISIHIKKCTMRVMWAISHVGNFVLFIWISKWWCGRVVETPHDLVWSQSITELGRSTNYKNIQTILMVRIVEHHHNVVGPSRWSTI